MSTCEKVLRLSVRREDRPRAAGQPTPRAAASSLHLLSSRALCAALCPSSESSQGDYKLQQTDMVETIMLAESKDSSCQARATQRTCTQEGREEWE